MWYALRNYKKTHRLSARLLFYILLISSLLTLLGTALQLYTDYRSDRGQINKDLQIIADTVVQPIANSIWNLDEEQVQVQLDGALKMRDMIYLQVEEHIDGRYRLLLEVGKSSTDNVVTREFELNYRTDKSVKKVGRLTAKFSLDGIYLRLQNKLLLILGTQFIKTFIVSLCILAIIHLLITRHLHHLANFASRINFNDLSVPLKLSRNKQSSKEDELDKVVNSINQLQQNLSIHLRERDDAVAELNTHKLRLEETVIHRTQALQDNMLQLQKEVMERKASEAKAKLATQQAIEANRAKSNFLASMSHEIRTPMNGVIGMLGLLLNNSLDKSQRDRAIVAQNSAHSLLSLINDILDFSKVEADKLELEELDFNPRELLNDVIKTLNFKAAEKNIELLLDVVGVTHSMYRGDPGRLRQIMVNLIGNAIKFTEQGEILIRAITTKIEEDSFNFVCRVEDTGIGIPQNELTNLFNSFTQVDASTTRRFGGTGLGLAICKKLCILMQGDITVTSIQGEGSCFEFNVLLLASNNSKPTVPSVDISQLNILIVDNNQTNRDIFKSQLETWGATTVQAKDAKSALDICEKYRHRLFDIALLDMDMSDMQGLILAKSIRKIAAYNAMKLIILSSASDIVTPQKLKKVGVEASFIKPITDSELFYALSAVCASDNQPLITSSYLSTVNYSSNLSEQDSMKLMCEWPANTRILLVEDNEVNQMVSQGILGELGLQCEIAANGWKALDKLQAAPTDRPFTLILMDIEMPELDGYDTSQKIRQGEAGSHHQAVAIVAMTAHAMQGAREQRLAAGMDDYLAKPIMTGELFTICKKWLMDREQQNLDICYLSRHQHFEAKPRSAQQLAEPIKSADSSSITWPHNLRVFDYSDNKPSILASPRLFLKVISTFSNHYQDFTKNIKSYIAADNIKLLQPFIHAVKGSSGNIGLHVIYDLAALIEYRLTATGKIEADSLLELSLWLEKARMDIEDILDINHSLQAVTSVTGRDFPTLANSIYELLVNNEYVSQELIDEFLASAKVSNKVMEGTAIAKRLDAFEYPQALKLLKKER